VKKRLGFNYRNRGRFLTDKIDIEGFCDKHVIEYYLDILSLLGIDPEKHKSRPDLHLSEQDILWARDFLKDNGAGEDDLAIGVMPGCGASWGPDARYRRWDKEGFVRVCDAVADKYKAVILLFGDKKEVEICQAIQNMMKNRVIICAGKTTLGGLLGLIKRCRVVITNDGGPLHMAAGIGVRTVSIFWPVDERIYGPYPLDPKNIVVSKSGMPCRPCYRKFKYNICEKRACLKSIRPDDILEAVDKALAARG